MSKWIPPQLVHLIVQYSQSDRPAMTRRTASRALHCGQLESTVAEGDRVGPDSGMGCCSLQVIPGWTEAWTCANECEPIHIQCPV